MKSLSRQGGGCRRYRAAKRPKLPSVPAPSPTALRNGYAPLIIIFQPQNLELSGGFEEVFLFDYRLVVTSIPWLAVLGSTLCWSAFDGVRKKLVERVPVAAVALWIWFAQIPGYLLWTLWEAKWSIGGGYVVPAALSIGLNVLANILFLESVQRGPLSVTIPILSFTPVFTALSSIPLLGETLSLAQWMGILAVTTSSVFLTADARMLRTPHVLVTRFFRSPGVLPMLGVAVLWSLTPLFDKLALRHTSIGLHGGIMALLGGLAMGLVLVAQKKATHLRLPQSSLGLFAFGGMLNVAALGLQLLSITQMVVSIFEAFKRAGGILIALAVGSFVFGETPGPLRILAALCMAAGVVFVLRG